MSGIAITGRDDCWFAIQVKPRSERVVATVLKLKGYQEFLPLYRARHQWSDRIKELDLPLFPGYVFARFNEMISAPIMTTPGVIRIVGHANHPVPIADSEIDALQNVVRAGLITEPWQFVQVGERVRILAGPLAGAEGPVVRLRNKWRLIVSVTLLQRSVAVEIDYKWITPISGPILPRRESRASPESE